MDLVDCFAAQHAAFARKAASDMGLDVFFDWDSARSAGEAQSLRLGHWDQHRAVMADGYGEWSVQMAVVIPCYTMLYHVIPCYTSPLDMGNYM